MASSLFTEVRETGTNSEGLSTMARKFLQDGGDVSTIRGRLLE